MKNQDELLKILREVEKNPNISQRELAANVNFSLGKLNYCLNALKIKGFVKMNDKFSSFEVNEKHDLNKKKFA